MARDIFVVFLFTIYSAVCMEMRETVERMVMVRTTGSDLQPAATGFIYKRNSDGPAKVTKMEEDEVLEHLKKLPEDLYEEPKAFIAPIPTAAGPFEAKEDDGNKAASRIIPVVETNEDDKGDKIIDGIAEEDYGKLFGEYATDYGDHKSDFGDYLHGVGHFGHDHHGEHGGGSDYEAEGHEAQGEKGHKGFASSHHYGKGGAGDYHTENYESFSISGGGGQKKAYGETDAYGAHYAKGNAFKGDDHGYKAGHSKGEETDGYHKLFQKDELKKDHDFYDGEALKGGFDKFGHGHVYHGSDARGFKKSGSHDSGHHETNLGKGGFHDQESEDEHGVSHTGEEGAESYHHRHGDYGAKRGFFDGKGYGFKVKHR